MRRMRLWLRNALWWATTRFGRRPPADPEATRRQDFRWQTRGMGLRFSDWLRDRLRPRWLRVRHSDEHRG